MRCRNESKSEVRLQIAEVTRRAVSSEPLVENERRNSSLRRECDEQRNNCCRDLIAYCFLACFGQYVGVRNTLVAKDQAVKGAWSQVDIVSATAR